MFSKISSNIIAKYSLSYTIIFILLTILSFSRAENICQETVDIRGLTSEKITIFIPLPKEYLNTLQKSVIHRVCRERLPDTFRCDSVIIKEGLKTGVLLDIEKRSTLKAISIKTEPQTLLTFQFKYHPVSFLFTEGYAINRHDLMIKLPTHIIESDNIDSREISVKFKIKDEYIKKNFELDKKEYILGDYLELPRFQGDLCVYALIPEKKHESDIVYTTIACEKTVIGIGPRLKPGNYLLYILILKAGQMQKIINKITIAPQQFPLSIEIEKEDIYLGSVIKGNILYEKDIEICRVELIDKNGVIKSQNTFTLCNDFMIATSTSWAPGKYIIRVSAESKHKKSSISKTVNLIGKGFGSGDIFTDKDIYTAGETISIFQETQGDICVIELIGPENIVIKTIETPGCEEGSIKLSESLEPGKYLIKTTVYSQGKIISILSRAIEVKKWSPKPKSQKQLICPSATFTIGEYMLSCIGSGMICRPSSVTLPLCLCFSSRGDIVDICKYNAKCRDDGCVNQPLKTPYIIIQDSEKCIAKRGFFSIKCIYPGEICSGNCVCLSDDTSLIDNCVAGQVCSYKGCKSQNIEFRLISHKPLHARVDSIKSGITLIWKGYLRFKGRFLEESDKENISLRGGVMLAKKYPCSPENTMLTYSVSDNIWTFTCILKQELVPGAYSSFLELWYEDEMLLVRRDFEVWYPSSQKNLYINITDITPSRISIKSLISGVELRLKVKITDQESTDLSQINIDTIHVSIGDIKAKTITARYNPLTKLWTIITTFKTEHVPENTLLKLAVDSLGRTGQTTTGIQIMEKIPLNIMITRVIPGSQPYPLYSAIVNLGFDIDIFIKAESAYTLSAADFKVYAGNKDISSFIQYLTSTAEGLKLYLKDVRLCPPPKAGAIIPLRVEVSKMDEKAADVILLKIIGNPGNWITEGVCQ